MPAGKGSGNYRGIEVFWNDLISYGVKRSGMLSVQAAFYSSHFCFFANTHTNSVNGESIKS